MSDAPGGCSDPILTLDCHISSCIPPCLSSSPGKARKNHSCLKVVSLSLPMPAWMEAVVDVSSCPGPSRCPTAADGREGPWGSWPPCSSPSGGCVATACLASLRVSTGTRAQGEAGHPCVPPTLFRGLPPRSAPCPSVRVAAGRALSVDGQADVGVLVVEQPRHGHGLVALAQHLLLDAGRPDVIDEILQRLQAAAQHRCVAHALAGQA